MQNSHDPVRSFLEHAAELIARECQRSESFRTATRHFAQELLELAGQGPHAPRHPAPAGKPASVYAQEQGESADLGMVERRCRLKAEACLFAIDRNAFFRLHNRIDEYKERYDALIARAKDLPRCILWMVRLDMMGVSEEAMRQAHACYSNLADAATLMRAIDARGASNDDRRVGYELMAEAQSALMVTFSRHTRSGMDQDQFDAWTWVKEQAAASGLFLDKFMSRESKADPALHADLARRIVEARTGAIAQA